MKVYRAHLAPIVAVSASADGQLFASVAEDQTAKVFDVVNFGECPPYDIANAPARARASDMINMLKLGYTPNACCWVHRRGQAMGVLAMCVSSRSPGPSAC